MPTTLNERWSALLQERVEHIKSIKSIAAAKQIQVVVQAFASANLAMYDDEAWAKYRLGEIYKIQDPATGQPATRNQWFASKNPPVNQPPGDRANAYYSDISIEGLQRRGVLFGMMGDHPGTVAEHQHDRAPGRPDVRLDRRGCA